MHAFFIIWPSYLIAYVQPLFIIEKFAIIFSENEGGGRWPLGIFPKVHPIWYLDPSLRTISDRKRSLQTATETRATHNYFLLTISAYLPACLPGNAQTMHLCHLERLNNKSPQKSENANPLNCKTLCQ